MRILALLSLLMLSPALQAFGTTGHALVCNLAYQLMQNSTRDAIKEILSDSPKQQFSASCSWADEVREDKTFAFSSPWHYVNFSKSTNSLSAADCPKKGCILSAITQMRQRLSENKQDWQALLFLAHFIGDLHQPLHVSYADDLGGNRTAVYFYGEPSNLHGVWDYSLLKQAGYDDDATKGAALLQSITDEQRQSWRQGTPLDWAQGSAAITRAIYRNYKAGMLIDERYQQQQLPVLEQRIQQAAVRLAWLLDTLLGTH